MLDIDLTTVIFQIINFSILVVVLYFLLFKKIVQRAEIRKAELENIRQAALDNYRDSEALRSELETSINEFNKKLEEHTSKAKSEIEVARYQVISDIKAEAEQIYRQSLEEAKLAQKQSFEGFQSGVINVALTISKRLLSDSAPNEIHEKMVNQITERVWELGKGEMRQVETIRRSLKDREPILSITTAKPLTKDQQGNLIRTFTALADKNIKLEINHDENLISGLHVRLGDYIIENSLSSKLEEIKESVLEDIKVQLNSLINAK